MIQLSAVLIGFAIIFGYIGFTRGWNKEIIATAGIILGIFALFQFDDLVRNRLLGEIPRDQVFYIQTLLFIVIVFFAYQTRSLGKVGGEGGNRSELQTSLLGALMGVINGYLVWGTLWFFLEVNDYPLSPYIVALGESTAAFPVFRISPFLSPQMEIN